MIDSSPDWADTEPNPPLAARKAVSLADAMVRATVKEQGQARPQLERSLVGVYLEPLGEKKWCWEVCYEWHVTIGAETGNSGDFSVFVLMNGTVVRPVRVDREPSNQKNSENKGAREAKGDSKPPATPKALNHAGNVAPK
jgi:hypothetical protein